MRLLGKLSISTGLCILLCLLTAASELKGNFLGDDVLQFKATGFFRVDQRDGVWWLVTPDGYAFYSMGVNHVTPKGYYAPKLGYSPYEKSILATYGNREKWAEETRRRLKEWGFNTIGAWSKPEYFPEFPYTLMLDLASLGGSEPLTVTSPDAVDHDELGLPGLMTWVEGTFQDVFDPEWERKVFKEAERVCAPKKNDPYLIGYFTDNELKWGPDWRGLETMLELYMKFPYRAAGKKRLIQFFRERYHGDFSAFEQVWKSGARNFQELAHKKKLGASWWWNRGKLEADVYAFDGLVAQKYFSVSAKAIRGADPNHLLLGCRFTAVGVSPEIVKAAGKWMDAISINYYYLSEAQDILPKLVGSVSFSEWMKKYHQLSGKPIISTEFSWRARDSGLPNTWGAPVTVPSQRDRAVRYHTYALNCQSAYYVIGYHWFNYIDEPKEGRFDGENSNYGLVNTNDRPYDLLMKEISRLNHQAYLTHSISSKK